MGVSLFIFVFRAVTKNAKENMHIVHDSNTLNRNVHVYGGT